MPADRPAADLHWFPWFPKDFLSSPAVQRMTLAQEGAYRRLLDLAWGEGRSEPCLPADDEALASMSKLGKKWGKLGPLIRAQFYQKDDLLYNAKLSEVWKEQQTRHAKAVEKAQRAGRASGQRRANFKRTPSSLEANHAGMNMDLRDQKDLSSRGAGAPAPSEARPAQEPVREVRNGGGLRSVLDIMAGMGLKPKAAQ